MIIPVFDELKTAIRASKLPLPYISYRSGVRRHTIRLWLTETTLLPRIDSMMRVAMVLGQHIELTGHVKTMVNYYPQPAIRPPPITKPRGLSRHDWRVTMLKLQ